MYSQDVSMQVTDTLVSFTNGLQGPGIEDKFDIRMNLLRIELKPPVSFPNSD